MTPPGLSPGIYSQDLTLYPFVYVDLSRDSRAVFPLQGFEARGTEIRGRQDALDNLATAILKQDSPYTLFPELRQGK